jgi:hypothetical protein
MDRTRYDEYVRRFNAADATAFDDFLHPEMRMQNGHLRYVGVQGMKDHYARIWRCMQETLVVRRFVSDGRTLAVHLHTRFEVRVDSDNSPFGPVLRGESFDFDGIVMYEVERGRFVDIKVSYLDFGRTGLDGRRQPLGIVH